MRRDRRDDPLDVYIQSGLIVYFDLDSCTLFVQLPLWEDLPEQQRLMVITEAAKQCAEAIGLKKKALRVEDIAAGTLVALEGEAY